MSSSYALGFGSTISYANISGGTAATYTKIGQSVDVESPMPEVGDVKITNNDSPNNSHEYAPGLIEPGDVEFSVVWNHTAHAALLPLAGNGTIYSFQETFPSKDVCTFPGYFKSVGVESKTEDEALHGKLKVKVAGPVVWSVASGS